ncbi:S-layer homology domain-containing protein [Paenibacillus sp. P26]|nr:S-layer homology domain-containing protein [Paenibacillus sp. P26]
MRSLHKHTVKLTLMLFLGVAAVLHDPVLAAAAGEAGEILKDTRGHWAEQEIGEAVRKGYVSGYGDGSFRPEEMVSRIHYIVMLVKLMKYPVVASPRIRPGTIRTDRRPGT